MSTLTPTAAAGLTLYDALPSSMRTSDDASDNKVANVYAHVPLEFSATEKTELQSLLMYIAGVTQGAQVRNFIQNRSFEEFTVASILDNQEGPNKWKLLLEAANAAIPSQSTDAPTNSKYSCALTVGSANNNKFGIMQVLGNIDAVALRGKKISLSVQLKATAGIVNCRIALVEFTGTIDAALQSDPINVWGAENTVPTYNLSGANLATPTTCATTTSWVKHTIEGATVGASAVNLGIFIWVEDETTTTTTDILRIAEVQLTQSSASLAFTYLQNWLQSLVARPTSLKNRIINGAMEINQRNPTASGATAVNSGYTVDRFQTAFTGGYGVTPTWTWDPSVPTVAQAGRIFTKSFKLLSTQDTTPGTDGQCYVRQKIEGYNISDILGSGYNTGFTLSFWVRNSLVGTYCVCLSNSARDRSYVAEYTINVADTWEKKVLRVSAAPTGTWVTGNGIGLNVIWTLVSGTDYDDGTNGAWVTTADELCTSSQVNWASGAGTATFYLTGVQLEAGLEATPFEWRPFQQELALCERYYAKTYNLDIVPGGASIPGARTSITMGTAATSAIILWQFPQRMRIAPTVACLAYQSGTPNNFRSSAAADVGATEIGLKGETMTSWSNTGVITAGLIYSAHFTADAEL